MRRVLHIAGTIILVILVALLGSFIWLRSSSGEHFLNKKATALIENTTGFQASIATLETNIFSHLTLHDVVIRDSVTPGMVRIPTVNVQYSLFPLVRGSVEIDSILSKGIRIQFSQSMLNRMSSGKTKKGRSDNKRFTLNIGYIDVTDAAIIYTNQENHLKIRASGIRAQTIDQHLYTMQIDSIGGNYKQKVLPLSHSKIVVQEERDFWNIETVALGSVHSHFSASGKYSKTSNKISLSFKSRLGDDYIAFIQQLFPGKILSQVKIDPIDFHGKLMQQDSSTQYSGILRSDMIAYDTVNVYKPTLVFSGTPDSALIQKFTTYFGNTSDTLRVKGSVNWKKRAIFIDGTSHLTSLDYIQHFISIDSTLDASVDLKASGSIPYTKMENSTADVQIKLDNIVYKGRRLQSINTTAQITKDRFLVKIQQGNNKITANGVNQWPLQFDARASITDFTEIASVTNFNVNGSTQINAHGTIEKSDKFEVQGTLQSQNALSDSGLTVRLRIPYRFNQADFQIHSGTIQIADLQPDTVSANINFKPVLAGNITIREPSLGKKAKPGFLTANLHSDTTHQITGKLQLRRISLERWVNLGLNLSDQVSGYLDFDTQFNYTNHTVSGNGKLKIASLRLSKTIFDSTIVAFNMDSSGIDITKGKSYYENQIAQIDGYIPFNADKEMSVNISATDLPLTTINPFIPGDLYLQGKLNPEIAITGRLSSPQIDGKVELDSGYVVLSTHLSPIQDLTGLIHFSGAQFDVQYISFRYNDYPLNITGIGSYKPSFNGTIEIKPSGSANLFYDHQLNDSLNLSMDNVPLDLFKPFIPATFSATAKLNGQINGKHLDSKDMNLATNLTATRTGYKNGLDWAISLDATVQNQLLSLNQVKYKANQSSASLQAKVPIHLDSTDQQVFNPSDSVLASLDIQNLELSQLNSLLQTTTISSGVLNTSINTTGAFSQPNITGSLVLDSLKSKNALQTLNIDSGKVNIDFAGHSINIRHLAANVNSIPVDLAGNLQYSSKTFHSQIKGLINHSGSLTATIYNNSAKDSLHGMIKVDQVKLTDMLQFRQLKRNANGDINLDMALAGSRSNPDISLSGNIQNLQLENIQFATARLRANYKGEVFSLDSLYIRNNQSRISVTGKYPSIVDLRTFAIHTLHKNPYQFDLNVEGFPLSTLDVLSSKTVNVSGNFAASLHYTNSSQKPGMSGSIDVQSFGIDLPYFQQKIEGGVLHAKVASSTITIQKGEFYVDKTPVEIQGNADFAVPQNAQYDISVHTDQLSLSRPGELELTLAPTNLRLVSKSDQPVYIEGAIQFASFTYTKPVQSFRLLSLIGTRTVRPPIFTQQMLKDTRLNLSLQMLQNGKVKNNVANIDFTTDLQLNGPLFQPRYTGRIHSNKGQIFYLGKTFDITESTLLFGNNPGLNPDLNISATTKIPASENVDNIDYTVQLNITGTLHQPQVRFSADPSTRPHTNEPLTYSDIISLLAVGKPREQFSVASGEGNLQQLLLRQAQRFSSQKIASFVEYRVGRLLDLDRVAIEGNLFDLSGAHGPTFTAQKSISSRITLTYSTSIGNSNVQGARLNYELTPKIYIVTETNQQENYGIDLKYKIKFK